MWCLSTKVRGGGSRKSYLYSYLKNRVCLKTRKHFFHLFNSNGKSIRFCIIFVSLEKSLSWDSIMILSCVTLKLEIKFLIGTTKNLFKLYDWMFLQKTCTAVFTYSWKTNDFRSVLN